MPTNSGATSVSVLDMTTTGEQGGAFAWVEGVSATENQLRVAKNLGASDEVLARIADQGMDRSTFYHVVPAEAAEAHLTDKYGITFTATSATIDSTGESNVVNVTMEAAEGAHAGRSFDVQVSWSDTNTATYTEHYFAYVRADEYGAYLADALADTLASLPHTAVVIATPSSYLMVDDEWGTDTPIDRVAATLDGELSIVFAPSEDMTQDAYRNDLQMVLEAAASVNPALSFESGYVTQLESYDTALTVDNAIGYLRATRTEHRALCVWRLYGVVSEGVGGAHESA